MSKKYELLAPAGNFPMLVSAVKAGADSVYFGLNEFSMRKTAKNFKIKDLEKIGKICEEYNVKKYLTINVIIYDNELERLENIIKKVKEKVDAIICWDLSVIDLCKKYKIPFHISTQASVSNRKAAEFYKNLGAERIVLARELDLKQIKKISKIVEVETFIHGAMCMAISGRCFTSQFLFKKSANRGECLNPCRRSYIVKDKQQGYELEVDNNKILSAKDLCTLPFIEKLKEAGITTFKIEGRNRDPRYVDMVVRVYRKALDNNLTKKEVTDETEDLKKVYNRKFSSGFYLGLPTSDDFSDVENSAATEKRHFVGKIMHYFTKLGVATIKLNSKLKIGDNIEIIGKNTGIEKSKVKRLEIENKSVTSGKKGEEIALKLPKVNKNDEVYIILSSKII